MGQGNHSMEMDLESLLFFSSWAKGVTVADKIHLAQAQTVWWVCWINFHLYSRVTSLGVPRTWYEPFWGDLVTQCASSTGLVYLDCFLVSMEFWNLESQVLIHRGKFSPSLERGCGASPETHYNTVVTRPQPLQVPRLLIALILNWEV